MIDWTEVFGFVTGVLNVWLLARQKVWNWPIGLANNAAYLILFFRAGLYGDGGLQLLYITLGIYGWWTWARGGGNGTGLQVGRTSAATWRWLVPATAVAALALSLFPRAIYRFHGATLGRADDSALPGGDLGTVPQTGGKLVDLDCGRSDLYPALHL